MGRFSAIIVNEGEPQKTSLDQPIDVALSLATADLKALFMDPETGVVRYGNIRGSEAFGRYRALAAGLRGFDPARLVNRQQRLAFWVNVYNAAVIHGVIELGIRRSVKEFPRFFRRVAYDIGGRPFSLNDMEHGVLRGNRKPPGGLKKPFGAKDPRSAFSITPVDPRIHFALVCGARSCPPIGFYEADRIDFQLQLAATSFVNSEQVEVLPRRNTVRVSKIFRWYRADFGGSDASLIDTFLEYLDEGDAKRYLRENRGRVAIRYKPYDWSLNE